MKINMSCGGVTISFEIDGQESSTLDWEAPSCSVEECGYEHEKDKDIPRVLYAIQNEYTGQIIFNARGGAYQDLEAAKKKLIECGGTHKIVEYKLVG